MKLSKIIQWHWKKIKAIYNIYIIEGFVIKGFISIIKLFKILLKKLICQGRQGRILLGGIVMILWGSYSWRLKITRKRCRNDWKIRKKSYIYFNYFYFK